MNALTDTSLLVSIRQARVKLADDRGSAGIAGTDRALKRLRALLELLEVGVAGKTAGWHKGLLSPRPGVRNHGLERRTLTNTTIAGRWASPFPRTGGALRANRS